MRLADPLLPRKLHREDNVVEDRFINSKKDKLLIKHSAFVNKIIKNADKTNTGKSAHKNKKRRRPNKKLVATLESLEDALDDIKAEMDAREAADGADGETMDETQRAQGKIRLKSLRPKPGALKKKEKIVRGEMERFKKSLAQLAIISKASSSSTGAASSSTVSGTEKISESGAVDTEMGEAAPAQEQQQTAPSATSGVSSRWAALRGFIAATMEQNPAFINKTS